MVTENFYGHNNFTGLDDVDEVSEAEDMPNTFVGIQQEKYLLIITFHKFLMMLDGTLGKYICKNVDEGFVFSGDTSQTIARGVDFRFEDIKSLFYNQFLMRSRNSDFSSTKEKGLISDTHTGVLVDLICYYFPYLIDELAPETSHIYGEPPESSENSIISIFGHSGKGNEKWLGFGADQVILVRDDSARKEISSHIAHQALILTIVDCKALDFQDVLLYNFFGSSPLSNQWRVVYEFLNKKDLFDVDSPKYFLNFIQSKHNILCSELNQLCMAITRTRQRLWICENNVEVSKPALDHWRKLSLVQVRKIDDFVAEAMQKATSTPEEWKSQGMKLFWEKNYEMATLCFKKAGEEIWERRAKASKLRAVADCLRREAAEIFESIDRVESAAESFYELGEYDRAGWPLKSFPMKVELLNRAMSTAEMWMLISMSRIVTCTWIQAHLIRDLRGTKSQLEHSFTFGTYGSYFGLMRLPGADNLSVTFHLMNPDAVWARDVNKNVVAEAHHFASAGRKFWLQDLVGVGDSVLNALQRLHKSSMTVMIMLGTGKLEHGLYYTIAERLSKDSPWKPFIEISRDSPLGCYPEALSQCLYKHWYKLMTLSSFLEYCMWLPSDSDLRTNFLMNNTTLRGELSVFACRIIVQCLSKDNVTQQWIENSDINDSDNYLRVLVLRMIMIVCVMELNGEFPNNALDLLFARTNIKSHLPKKFFKALKSIKQLSQSFAVSAIASAFEVVNDPLVLVMSTDDVPQLACPDEFTVRLRSFSSKTVMMKTLFS
ncbi:hypothetical protein C2S53_014256 [Perilla frutescens var. hirtella]|uniref:Uncharacterized protein n=1 Tax=Perilla frutescens var. hirtella TaxID=608512 RepID=A0AAD4JNE0_PERFH|nr:hypothetical protein C2S53_014256 [Perilla frutescens var. hirtella]